MTGARVLPVDPSSPDPGVLAEAAAVLASGHVVGIPTDTVYGVAVDPWRPGATDRLFAAKERPRRVVLPVLVGGLQQAGLLADPLSPVASRLVERWWPGPLTVVVGARADHGADIGGDGRTVGLRCPDHAVVRALCWRAGPLATTSANRHGEPPTTTAAELVAALPEVSLVLDAGPCGRPASTVVDASTEPVRLLRAGGLPWAEVLASLGGRATPGVDSGA